MLSDVPVKLEYYPVVKQYVNGQQMIECPHNDGCWCDKRNAKCWDCGWNPKVAEKRMAKILAKLGPTEVPHGD